MNENEIKERLKEIDVEKISLYKGIEILRKEEMDLLKQLDK